MVESISDAYLEDSVRRWPYFRSGFGFMYGVVQSVVKERYKEDLRIMEAEITASEQEGAGIDWDAAFQNM